MMKVQYKPKRNLLETIFHVEILQGLSLTLKKLFSKPITRQYPDEKPQMFAGFRGQHALVRHPETGQSKCVACMRCVTVCPSRCIHIKYHSDEDNQRIVEDYSIEALRCVFCGYCVEVCPVGAITMTEEFEYSTYELNTLYFNMDALLENWDNFTSRPDYNEDYVNPFWRPRGADEMNLAAAQRLAVPDDWTLEGQYVGPKAGQSEGVVTEREADNV